LTTCHSKQRYGGRQRGRQAPLLAVAAATFLCSGSKEKLAKENACAALQFIGGCFFSNDYTQQCSTTFLQTGCFGGEYFHRLIFF